MSKNDPGMSDMKLRDFFAAMAMIGLTVSDHKGMMWEDLANSAYRFADAMLEERKQYEIDS